MVCDLSKYLKKIVYMRRALKPCELHSESSDVDILQSRLDGFQERKKERKKIPTTATTGTQWCCCSLYTLSQTKDSCQANIASAKRRAAVFCPTAVKRGTVP